MVNHDLLMSILYREVKDERLLRLIRKYLKTGLLIGGLEQQRDQGTPQGSPLSPLLSNILLNELDNELTKRGLRFILMKKVKEITRKTRPLSFDQRVEELNDYLTGWLGYFRHANMQNKLKELDVRIRCRLRYCIWFRWLSGGRNQTSACVATFEWA